MLLNPGDVATFDVTFQPSEAGSMALEVHLLIVNNPFEKITILVMGDAYADDISIENFTPDPDLTTTQKDDNTANHIDYGLCFINKLCKYSFRLRNKSEKDVYKFSWKTDQSVLFTPYTGHLRPQMTKEVTAMFVPKLPTSLTQVS